MRCTPAKSASKAGPGESKRPGWNAGRTSAEGKIHLENLPPQGQCTLLLPDISAPKEGAQAAQGRTLYQPQLPVQAGTATVVELPSRVRRGQLTGMHFETAKTFLLP